MSRQRVIVVGGGAAGFLGAITCATGAPEAEVTLVEKGPEFLSKVRISGGGRCNVTHACFDPRDLTTQYPRGRRALIAPFHRFQPRDTARWFESRGVALKVESDGRMFPTTDSSQTIIDCLVREAKAAGVRLFTQRGVEQLQHRPDGGFELTFSNGDVVECDRVLLATGGCRAAIAGRLAVSIGHTLEPPVPSLFAFEINVPWLRGLAGISVESVEVSVPGTGCRECGVVLITHRGVSGPVVLRLSAWGARELHSLDYQFELHLNWVPHLNAEALSGTFEASRARQPSRLVVNSPIPHLPGRLWEQLVLLAGVDRTTRWAAFSRSMQHSLVQQLIRTCLPVTGKSLNRDEFVTCGGVRLSEVDFKTMESRIRPGLYFAGELLDIDGITGGFNFQAAWTTGWIAGQAMAGCVSSLDKGD